MAWTQTQLDALKAAYASGYTSVRDSDGKTVTYRSLDEMARIIQTIEASLAPTARSGVSYVRPSITRPRSGG